MEVLFVRELVSRMDSKTPPAVTITLVNPSMCVSSIGRNGSAFAQAAASIVMFVVARSAAVGARTYVYGANPGPQSHGMFMSDGKNQDVEAWIYSEMGKKAQAKVFEQTMRILEQRKPGVGRGVGLS